MKQEKAEIAEDIQPEQIIEDSEQDVMVMAAQTSAFTVDKNGVLTGFDPDLYGSSEVVIPEQITELR